MVIAVYRAPSSGRQGNSHTRLASLEEGLIDWWAYITLELDYL